MMDKFLQIAIDEAKKGLNEGGIPIGSALVRNGQLIGSYKDTVIYSTLMPCYMCAGTIVQFKIPIVIVGESKTFSGARKFMESHGVEVIDLESKECISMMEDFIENNTDLWNEDIGE